MSKLQVLIKEYKKSNSEKVFNDIIREIQTCETIWAAFSPVTKGYFIDYVQGVPTAFLFSEKLFCENYCRHMKKENTTVGVAECGQKAKLDMFSEFYRSGFENVIIDNGQDYLIIEMKKLINTPDFSKLPEDKQPVFNPSLVCSANRFFQCIESKTVTPDKELNLLVDTYNATYLIPVQGEVKDNTVSIPGLERSDGKKVVPFFTDLSEMRKFDPNSKFRAATAKFEQIENFCRAGETVVMNPFGFNFTIVRETCEAIHKAVEAVPNLKDSDRAVVYTPNSIPDELLNALSVIIDKTPEADKAYIKGLRKGEVNGLLVVIDFGKLDPASAKSVLDSIAEKAAKVTGEMPIEYIPARSDIGRVATSNSVPFYERIIVDFDAEPEENIFG